MQRTIEWIGTADGYLRLLDQTVLPGTIAFLNCRTVDQVREAICRLSVRGAPAIGVSAAYGVIVGTQEVSGKTRDIFDARLEKVMQSLRSSRPTAVNLGWALDRLHEVASRLPHAPSAEVHQRLFEAAVQIDEEDQRLCAAIGDHGKALLQDGTTVLTHCNAGGLATAGDGTALSVIFAAHAAGKRIHVYADETRPLLQGARLTAWECRQRGIPVTVICDNMAGWAMKNGRIQAVVTGADRIAANGDAANKIGTYSVALLAQAHGIPFYIAAPYSTFDFQLPNGDAIPIEERASEEITHGFGKQTVPDDVSVWNPAFDVTPAGLITALITDRGMIQPVSTESIRALLG